jgi:hypothetical protein
VPADALDRWLDDHAGLLAVARDAARYAIDTGMEHAMEDYAAWPAMRRRGRRPNRATFLAFSLGHVFAEITATLPTFSRDDAGEHPIGPYVELCVAASVVANVKGENAGEAAVRAHRFGRHSFRVHLDWAHPWDGVPSLWEYDLPSLSRRDFIWRSPADDHPDPSN